MDNDLLDFITSLDNSSTANEAWNTWVSHAKNIGFETVVYTYIENDANNNIKTTMKSTFDPKWISYYEEQNMQQVDHMVASVLEKKAMPIFHNLDELPQEHIDTQFKRDVYHYAAEFGLRYAIGVPLLDLSHGGYGGATVGSNTLSNSDFKQLISEKGSTIYTMALLAHQRLKDQFMIPDTNISLSQRQNEILNYLFAGRTNKHICHQLDISMSTVSFHIKQLATKLEVRTAREIVPKALNLGLLT
jgi:LuxR family quorum-sensing system transcriptional regulator ExpR